MAATRDGTTKPGKVPAVLLMPMMMPAQWWLKSGVQHPRGLPVTREQSCTRAQRPGPIRGTLVGASCAPPCSRNAPTWLQHHDATPMPRAAVAAVIRATLPELDTVPNAAASRNAAALTKAVARENTSRLLNGGWAAQAADQLWESGLGSGFWLRGAAGEGGGKGGGQSLVPARTDDRP
jgi:hypothetical protein